MLVETAAMWILMLGCWAQPHRCGPRFMIAQARSYFLSLSIMLLSWKIHFRLRNSWRSVAYESLLSILTQWLNSVQNALVTDLRHIRRLTHLPLIECRRIVEYRLILYLSFICIVVIRSDVFFKLCINWCYHILRARMLSWVNRGWVVLP